MMHAMRSLLLLCIYSTAEPENNQRGNGVSGVLIAQERSIAKPKERPRSEKSGRGVSVVPCRFRTNDVDACAKSNVKREYQTPFA
jgi:hypothetical protein